MRNQANTLNVENLAEPKLLTGLGLLGRPMVISVLVFSTLLHVLLLVVPLYPLQLFDRVLSSGSTETLVMLTLLVAGALIASACLDLVRTRMFAKAGLNIVTQLNERVLARAIHLGARDGTSLSARISDVDIVSGYVGSRGFTTLLDVAMSPFYLVILFLLDSRLAYFVSAGMAIIIVLIAVFHRFSKATLIAEESTQRDKSHDIQRLAAVTMSARASGFARNEISNRSQSLNTVAITRYAHTAVSHVIETVVRNMRGVLQLGVIGIGAWLVLEQECTPGAMIAASILAVRAFSPLEGMLLGWRSALLALQSWNRLKLLFKDTGIEQTSLATPKDQTIVIEGVVDFAKPNADPYLKGINATLETGTCSLIAGSSGNGKTLLGEVLVGLRTPTRGKVLMGGVPVHLLSQSNRPAISYLPSDQTFFNESDLLAYGPDKRGLLSEISNLADQCGINANTIRTLAIHSDDSPVTSKSERLLLSLMAEMTRDPDVYVIDDPFDHLDADGLAVFANAMMKIREQNKTVIILSKYDPGNIHIDQRFELSSGLLKTREGRASNPVLVEAAE